MTTDTNAIEARAIEWLVRQDAGTLSAAEWEELDAWLDSDSRHRGAYIQAEANWLVLDRWAAHRRTEGERPTAVAPGKPPVRFKWTLAAGVALLTLAASGVWWQFEHRSGEVYSSVAGEIRSIALSDGSHLTLDAGSVATVHFEEASREILLDRGEAYVAVARDPSRPFVVRTKDAEIRALGTAFAVRILDGNTNILVSQGIVEVLRPGQKAGQGQKLSAQQSATVSPNAATPAVEAVPRDVLERKLAWQEGKASFAGEPLSVAVAEINRHSRLQVFVDDSALASERVIGVFNASDAEVFANAVGTAFNAQVVRESDGLHLKPETEPRAEE